MSSITTASPELTRTTFVRYELKLRVTPDHAIFVSQWAHRYLPPDSFAGPLDASYPVTTLYLDSRDFDIYHRVLDDGTKYRIRRYGDEDQVFLERKIRRENFVRKKRRPWPLAKLKEVLKGDAEPSGWAGVFKRKIRARRLVPMALVTYTRHAWVCGPHARLTLDTDIQTWSGRGIRRLKRDGAPVTVTGGPVVELKYEGPRPGYFDALLESLDVGGESFSKYGRSIEALGFAVTPERSHA